MLLRVLVSPAGEALAVELLTSSGYPRLDAAARKMVAKWRFIPANKVRKPFRPGYEFLWFFN